MASHNGSVVNENNIPFLGIPNSREGKGMVIRPGVGILDWFDLGAMVEGCLRVGAASPHEVGPLFKQTLVWAVAIVDHILHCKLVRGVPRRLP